MITDLENQIDGLCIFDIILISILEDHNEYGFEAQLSFAKMNSFIESEEAGTRECC